MKIKRKIKGKIFFSIVPILIVLFAMLSICTTLGKYTKDFEHTVNIEITLTQDIFEGGGSSGDSDTPGDSPEIFSEDGTDNIQ